MIRLYYVLRKIENGGTIFLYVRRVVLSSLLEPSNLHFALSFFPSSFFAERRINYQAAGAPGAEFSHSLAPKMKMNREER